MKKSVSIFEKKWIDLVFEGKNQNYGAYQLRQENSKTSLIAFFYGLSFIVSVSVIGLLLSSFNEVLPTPIIPTEPVVLVKVYTNNLKTKKVVIKKEKVAIKKASPTTPVPIPSKDPEIEIKNDDPVKPSASTGTADAGILSSLPATTANTIAGDGEKKPFEGIANVGMLDKQPDFPGGIDRFYSYVASKFQKPGDVEGTIRIVVSFVIEPDGSMSNIKATQDADSSMAQEAIRVLKSLKTKWIPGVIYGEKVRTMYRLPIVIKLEE